jgi:hypothetical protein
VQSQSEIRTTAGFGDSECTSRLTRVPQTSTSLTFTFHVTRTSKDPIDILNQLNLLSSDLISSEVSSLTTTSVVDGRDSASTGIKGTFTRASPNHQPSRCSHIHPSPCFTDEQGSIQPLKGRSLRLRARQSRCGRAGCLQLQRAADGHNFGPFGVGGVDEPSGVFQSVSSPLLPNC